MLHFHFITLFPSTIEIWLSTSILGRAHKAGLFDFSTYQLRDYSRDKHRSVDDVAYGGGGGMVLKIEPLVDAVGAIRKKFANVTVVYFSPGGEKLSQTLVNRLSPPAEKTHYVMVCGHYEGADQRFIEHWVDLEVSLGDFVLTGGELPAVAMADAMIRQLEGTLGYESAPQAESFTLCDPATGARLLEYPHYTRPAEFRGHRVPEVLLSGDHEKIARWRLEQSLQRTRRLRPELLLRDATRTDPTSGSEL